MNRVLLALSLLATGTLAFSQAVYDLQEIPPLPGRSDSTAEAINESGVVVGTSGNSGFFSARAFQWSGGAPNDLGTLPGAEYSYAHHLNDSGVIVGEGDTGDVFPQALRWLGGDLLNIEPNGGSNIRAIHVTSSGVIVGNYAHGFSGNASSWRPTIWTERLDQPGRFRSVELQPWLGGDPNSDYAYVYCANDSEQVVGVVQSTLFGQYGAYWNGDVNHTLSLLFPQSGYHQSYAYGVNNSGVAVGESVGAFLPTRPTMWLNDGAHTAIALPLPMRCSAASAEAISDSGTVIGSGDFGGSRRGIVWRSGVPIDLLRIVNSQSSLGWSSLIPLDLNERGQIVGVGQKNGHYRGFVLNPRPESRSKSR